MSEIYHQSHENQRFSGHKKSSISACVTDGRKSNVATDYGMFSSMIKNHWSNSR